MEKLSRRALLGSLAAVLVASSRFKGMTSLQSTLADLTAAKLVAYYPVPSPGLPVVQPSTDPAVYVSDPSYIKHLNQQCYQKYAVDVPNKWEADRYNFRCKQWEMAKSNYLPAPPKFVIFDGNAFDLWWSQYQERVDPSLMSPNYGHDAPPLFFVKPEPLPPDPIILAVAAPPTPVAALDGPIGAAVPNNPGVYSPSGNDEYPDGALYAGPSGIYQKHIYSNPFTAGQTRVIWIALTPAIQAA